MILCVVLPFFVHSVSLISLRPLDDNDGASGSGSSFLARTKQLLDKVTPGNCFLQHPELVKWKGPGERRRGRQPVDKKHWEASKRRHDLKSVCIKPAARSKIQHATVAEIMQRSPANRQLFKNDAVNAPNRRVVWWDNQGRIELRFDLTCTPVKRAHKANNSWTTVATVRHKKCETKSARQALAVLVPSQVHPLAFLHECFAEPPEVGQDQGADQAFEAHHVHEAGLHRYLGGNLGLPCLSFRSICLHGPAWDQPSEFGFQLAPLQLWTPPPSPPTPTASTRLPATWESARNTAARPGTSSPSRPRSTAGGTTGESTWSGRTPAGAMPLIHRSELPLM